MIHTSFSKSKTVRYLTGTILAVICTSVIAANAATCPEDLIAYWRLGETAGPYLDSIGGRDGTCTDCPSTDTDGAIASDNAQSFNGSDTVISIPSDAIFSWLETDSFSVELWVKRDANSSAEVLIGRDDATNSTQWKLEILADGRARFTLRASDGDLAAVTSTKIIDNNVWHHIAAVRNGASDEILLYVDGVAPPASQTTKTYSAGFSSDADLTLGSLGGASDWFGGVLDEVAIYNSALSDVDIRSHYFLSRPYCAVLDSRVRIMPLGDSITDDDQTGTTGNGYRKPLWDDLYANQFWVDFVGSRQSATSDFDNEHEGHPAWSDDQIADNVQDFLDDNPADVVLLHIGTNDLDTDPSDVQTILNNIDGFSSGDGKRITVVLARIINRIGGSSDTTIFNDNVESMADTRIANGDKIIMVDMEDGAGLIYDYDYNGGDFINTLHPHDGGYVKMSDQWYATLDTFLPMVESPQITSTPLLEVTTGEPYTYDANATGFPAPTFSLTTGPTGMTINSTTGLVQWTPGQAGDEDVVIQARNVDEPWGGTTQSFTISAADNAIPQITSTAPTDATIGTEYTYSAVASDDDGDTLAWSLDFGPSGMSVNPATGEVTWMPAEGDAGDANCAISVADGKGGEATQNFTITVTSSSENNDGSGGGGSSGCFIHSLD